MSRSSSAVARDFMKNFDGEKKRPLQPLHPFPNSAAPLMSDDRVPDSSALLTIFYKGSVNVYDNVTVEKARAIMLLAGQKPVSSPVVKNVTEFEASNIGKDYKIQPNLPIATRRSLRQFFDKRRDRIMKRVPYVHPKEEESSV